MDPIPIKSLYEGTKVLCSLIDTIIKKGDCFDAWEFVAHNCANGSFQIQGINFDQYYIPDSYDDSFRINIAIVDTNIVTASILDVSNAFQNTNVTIHERVCVGKPPFYLDCFERPYPNVTLNRYEGPFFLQCTSGIQRTKLAGQQWNQLFDAVIIILKY